MKLDLTPDDIKINLEAKNKEEALKELVHFLSSQNHLLNQEEEILNAVKEREILQSTGIGDFVAVPHAKTELVDKLYIIAATAKEGIDFEAIDEKPAKIFFLLVSSRSYSGPHVKALGVISKLLLDETIKNNLIQAETPGNFHELFIKYQNISIS